MERMRNDLEGELKRQVSLGRRVALASTTGATGAMRELLVWASGETMGDLGSPRLNQRAALYAEQHFDRGHVGHAVKRFKDARGLVEVRFEFPNS